MRAEERGKVAVLGCELHALCGAGLDLSPGAHQALACGRTKGLDVAVQGCRNLRHPDGDRHPVRVRLGRHQVEDVADCLQRAGKDVQGHLVKACGVSLLGQAEALIHRGHGHPVDVVDGSSLAKSAKGLGAQVGLGGVTRRREIVEVLVVTGDPQVRRGDGAQVDERIQILVGDAVDGR